MSVSFAERMRYGMLLATQFREFNRAVCTDYFGAINVGLVNEPNPREANRKIIAKKFLWTTGDLCSQVIASLNIDGLLLSAVGLRSLAEEMINARYIYRHPKNSSPEWMFDVCDDFYNRSKAPTMRKNKLNDEGLKERAREVELLEFHDTVYADLCNYSHAMWDAYYIADLKIKDKNTLITMGHCLDFSLDVLDSISVSTVF